MLRKKLFERKSDDVLDLSLVNCPDTDVSKYFPNASTNLDERLIQTQIALNEALSAVDFYKSPIEYVYNPTEYAKVPFEMFIRKFSHSNQKILFVGMNPGPFGMCQTGVPFGDTNWVKNWLKIEGLVHKPLLECPTRPILGFACTRKEQSGDRFWKFWYNICSKPENFFRNSFVYNYCPLAFMNNSGKNFTPAEIKDSKQLEAICDKAYADVLQLFNPDIVIAIGRYVEKRSNIVLRGSKKVLFMPHPSPRTVNNHDWPQKAQKFLEINNLLQYYHQ